MPKFFYSTRTPHRYSSGPFLSTLNDSYQEIASLEEAKQVALAHSKGRWGQEDFVEAKYGIIYDLEDEL